MKTFLFNFKKTTLLICAIFIGFLSTAQPLPELIYYDFNGSGTSVTNLASSPVGNQPATIVGGYTQGGSGFCGGALNGFSGTGNSVNTGWATNLGTGSWTISFAYTMSVVSGNVNYLLGDQTAAGFRCFSGGVANPGNTILRGPIGDIRVIGGANVGTYVNTYVYNASTQVLSSYLDGVLSESISGVIPNIIGTGFFVGTYGTGNGLATGDQIDEFRLYNRALSPAEILSLVGCPNTVIALGREIILVHGN